MRSLVKYLLCASVKVTDILHRKCLDIVLKTNKILLNIRKKLRAPMQGLQGQMSKGDKTLKHGNVNGVMLSLKVDGRNSSPKSRQFTISYSSSSEEKRGKWTIVSLLVAILANIVFLVYVRISLTVLVVIVTVLSFLVFFWVTHSVQSETLLVISTVGIQSSVQYVVGREDNFVPWTSIDDIIINEAIKLNRVLYFLTLLVKIDSECEPVKLIPLFKYTKPRLLMLESIYKEIQDLLTEHAVGAGDTGD